jgi:ankyrin repeat protein
LLTLLENDPLALAAIGAIHTGDLDGLRRLLVSNDGLATATITRSGRGDRSDFSYPLIAAAVDWPGHFPNAGQSIATLVEAGADVNVRCVGAHHETPLHWAASCDDVDALDALLDAGADIEAPGAVIAGGTPLDDAVAFAQWSTARRLVQRGAKTAIWHAAALGLMDRIEAYFADGTPSAAHPWGGAAVTPADDVNIAFWCACHGGQLVAAQYLLDRGVDINWVSPWDRLTPLDAARRGNALEVTEWLTAHGAKVGGAQGP